MSNAQDIRDAMAELISADGIGETIYYASRLDTSGSFAAFVATTGLLTEKRQSAEDSEDGRGKNIIEHCTARLPESVDLYPGDRIKDSDDKVWVIIQQMSGALGVSRYELMRSYPQRAGAARGRRL